MKRCLALLLTVALIAIPLPSAAEGDLSDGYPSDVTGGPGDIISPEKPDGDRSSDSGSPGDGAGDPQEAPSGTSADGAAAELQEGTAAVAPATLGDTRAYGADAGTTIDIENPDDTDAVGWSYSGEMVTIEAGGDYHIRGTGVRTAHSIQIRASAPVRMVLDNVFIQYTLPIQCYSDTEFTLIGDNKLLSTDGAALYCEPGASVHLTGTGSLTAESGDEQPGIFITDLLGAKSTLTVSGGVTITATGGTGAPGIGGTAANSLSANGGAVVIEGGWVYATGGAGASDIGSSVEGSDGGSLTVTGGELYLMSGGTDAATDFENCVVGGAGAAGQGLNGSYDASGNRTHTTIDIDDPDPADLGGGTGWRFADNTVTIEADGNYVIYGITGSNVIDMADGVTATLTLRDVTMAVSDTPLSAAGAKLTLTLEGSNDLSARRGPGIHVPEGSELIITAPDNSHRLDVRGGNRGAGIGGADGEDGGVITIKGGAVEAAGGSSAAGIGGGYEGAGGAITIKGGTVEAAGGSGAAGIGGGYEGAGGAITISGGTVMATGDQYGAGIGGGYLGAGGTIAIGGEADVTATSEREGAGIGGGFGGASGHITISGGRVTATGGGDGRTVDSGQSGGAGIGGGHAAAGETVIITGGEIEATGGPGAAGIGGGNGRGSGSITIAGDVTVWARATTGVATGAAIGGGRGMLAHGSAGTITIAAGRVDARSGGIGIGGNGGTVTIGGADTRVTANGGAADIALGRVAVGGGAALVLENGGANLPRDTTGLQIGACTITDADGGGYGDLTGTYSWFSLTGGSADTSHLPAYWVSDPAAGQIVRGGEMLNLAADLAARGMVFSRWIASDDGDYFADAANAATVFTMPHRDIAVAATYVDAERRRPSDSGGGGSSWTPATVTFTGVPTGAIKVGDPFTVIPSYDDQTGSAGWDYDSSFFSATFNSPATFTALSEGTSTITYTTLGGVKGSFTVTVGAGDGAAAPALDDLSGGAAVSGDGPKDVPNTGAAVLKPGVRRRNGLL